MKAFSDEHPWTWEAREQQRLWRELERFPPAEIIAALEPFVTEARRERLKAVFSQRTDAVTVVLDDPYDPHNGAAVIRTCDAFGIHRAHVIERSRPFRSSRGISMGSERWVRLHTYSDPQACLQRLREDGMTLVATHPDGELLPDDLRTMPRLALVFGNERDGIGPDVAAACSARVRIPMRGFVESLNLSVTAAILLERASADRIGDLNAQEQEQIYARALVLSQRHSWNILEVKLPHFSRA